MAHTPGPWRTEGVTGKGAWIGRSETEWAALALGSDHENARANARLIAAAPLMLAALQEIEEFLDNQADVDDGRPNDAMRLLVELRVALAAATA